MNNEKLSRYMGAARNRTTENRSQGYLPRGLAIPQSEVALETMKMKYKHAKTNQEKRITEAKLKEFIEKREMLDGKIMAIVQTTNELGMESGNLSEKQRDTLSDNDTNIILTRSQYENCFYPLVENFKVNCFDFK